MSERGRSRRLSTLVHRLNWSDLGSSRSCTSRTIPLSHRGCGNTNCSNRAALGTWRQSNIDTKRVAQATNNLQANRVRDGHRRRWRRGKQLVERHQLVRSNTGSVIDNRDDVVTRGRVDPTGDIHGGSRRGLLGGVFHQLSEKVGKVLGTMARNAEVFEGHRNDPAIILYLANSDSENFAELNWRSMTLRGFRISEYQQAFSVTAHTSSQVVNAIHNSEFVGIAFFGLEGVDRFELSIEKRLVAASEVHERVRNAALKFRDLTAEPHCALANRAQA